MGFKDWFMNDDTGKTYVAKVRCTNCNRITTVKIPHEKTFEKWSEHAKCGDCNTNSWEKTD
jgi:hypothetical protein